MYPALAVYKEQMLQYMLSTRGSAIADGPRVAPWHGPRIVNEGGRSISSTCDDRTKPTSLYVAQRKSRNISKVHSFG